MTGGRGPDSVIDAIGMEAHGSPGAKLAQQVTGLQANVKRWVDDIMPLLADGDPFGVESFATHRLPLDEAPAAYDAFQRKRDGVVKVLFQP